MASTEFSNRDLPRHRRQGGVLVLPVLLLIVVALAASAFITYVLWPRWPGPMATADAPPLPITVAGVAFNVPPAAIRVPVQRHPGEHERVDLAFLWPSLAPPDADANAVATNASAMATGNS